MSLLAMDRTIETYRNRGVRKHKEPVRATNTFRITYPETIAQAQAIFSRALTAFFRITIY